MKVSISYIEKNKRMEYRNNGMMEKVAVDLNGFAATLPNPDTLPENNGVVE